MLSTVIFILRVSRTSEAKNPVNPYSDNILMLNDQMALNTARSAWKYLYATE